MNFVKVMSKIKRWTAGLKDAESNDLGTFVQAVPDGSQMTANKGFRAFGDILRNKILASMDNNSVDALEISA